ncbi:putative hydrolase of the HAD superfamily [Kitasatospora sp. MAP12-15]|uniref:HAD family hydrolase n=1 Tax=unclassified Kitasatospora TaxID=2633591 RepID=UPI002474609F|nr:HAD family hydrolase [Kitasatospora sp. MAP12-44]MDH6112160.1 putative hydrolase of the HAD superfamily [Kitasatospora sp. MAP12-44]
MRIRAVLFDVDDTLFDYTGAERAAITAQLATEGLQDAFPSADDAVKLWHELMTAQYQRFLDGELTFPEQQLARARAFLATAREGSVAMDDATAREWFTRYQQHYRTAWRAFPDAAPALGALAAAGLRLGIVSNASLASQRPKLREVGLGGFFDGAPVVCSDQHGAPKPAASIFHAACAELELAPEQVAYVGDRHDVDGQGSRDAGLRAFWLNRTTATATAATTATAASADASPEATHGVTEIASLAELVPLLCAALG